MRTVIRFVVVFAFAILALPRAAAAQTVQVVQQDAVSAAQAATFTYRLYVLPFGATTPSGPFLLTGQTCTGTAPAVTCTAPLPAAASAALQVGAKSTATVQDTANGTAESAPSIPFPQAPSAPTVKVSKS